MRSVFQHQTSFPSKLISGKRGVTMEAENKEAWPSGNFLDVRIQVLLCLFLFNILVSFSSRAAPEPSPTTSWSISRIYLSCQEPKPVWASPQDDTKTNTFVNEMTPITTRETGDNLRSDSLEPLHLSRQLLDEAPAQRCCFGFSVCCSLL